MKITDSHNSSVTSSQVNQTAGADVAQRPRDRKVLSGDSSVDRAEISALTDQLRSLSASTPDRVSRVEQLTVEFRAGSYQPSADAVSKAILNDALARGASAAGGE